MEFDVKLTKDKQCILFHDEEFGRTVKNKVGKVGDYTLSELLKEVDAGQWHPSERFDGEPIAQFNDIISFCKSRGVWMNVEIKPEKGTDMVTGSLVAGQTATAYQTEIDAYCSARDGGKTELANKLLHDLPLFSSYSFEALKSAKAAAPDVPRAYLIKNLRDTPDWKEKCAELDVVAVHTDVKTLTEEEATEVKSLGYALMCYTVNTLEDYFRLLSYGVNSICTDEITRFAEVSETIVTLEPPRLSMEVPKPSAVRAFS